MQALKVTDNLVLEVWPSGGDGDRPLLRLRSLSQELDGQTPAGVVVIWPEEIRHLIGALVEAAGVLAEWEARSVAGDGAQKPPAGG